MAEFMIKKIILQVVNAHSKILINSTVYCSLLHLEL